jgi:molybdenum cofactor cytidylyltransferase
VNRSPSFCGIVLAAGDSSRMGRDKALLPWPPGAATGTFLSAQVDLLRQHSDMVLVVAGNNAERLRPVVYTMGAFMVVNPAPEQGQFSSLRAGLREVLNRGRDAAIISLVDRPPARGDTLDLLRERFLSAIDKGAWAVVPDSDGRHGHPVVVGREMIEAFLAAPPSATARDVEHAHQSHIIYVPVKDANVVTNVNTPEDYERLQTAAPRTI